MLQSTNKLLLQANMKEQQVMLHALQNPILSNMASGIVTHSGMLICIQYQLHPLDWDTAY